MHDAIVIGGGLIGSAATRYLSAAMADVVLVTPDRAAATGGGPFSSHDDDSRIVRRTTRDLTWATLTDRTLTAIGELERGTGRRVLWPRAGLHVAPLHAASPFLAAADAIVPALAVPCTWLPSTAAIEAAVPQVALPEPCRGLLEAPPAGVLAPHALIAVQLEVAARQGATVIEGVVATLRTQADHVRVVLRGGRELRARKVLITAGAYCRDRGLVPAGLDVRVKSEITVKLGVGPSDAARLAGLPTVVYECVRPTLDTLYLVPPWEGNPGELKLGCNTAIDRWLESGQAMDDWVARGDAQPAVAAMVQAAVQLLGLRQPVKARAHRCLVTYTPSGWPMIDELEPGLFVATGGNGLGAKSSDGLGALAAGLVLEDRWPDETLPATHFRAVRAPQDRPER